MILVDSSVLLDLATDDPAWGGWSQHQLERASLFGRLCINDVVYAEVSAGYRLRAEVDAFFARLGIVRSPIPEEALFRAGKAFLAYRRRGGSRSGVLPDFFIGAHAEAAGAPLLTRDPERVRRYFPDARVIAP